MISDPSPAAAGSRMTIKELTKGNKGNKGFQICPDPIPSRPWFPSVKFFIPTATAAHSRKCSIRGLTQKVTKKQRFSDLS
jgi:hypothetical protein